MAEYMSTHVAQMSDMTLSTLSDETSVSEATILRLCRRLGYSSYIQLRQAFAFAANEEHPKAPETISFSDQMPVAFRKLTYSLNRSLEDTMAFVSDDYVTVLNAILNSSCIYLFASGDAAFISQYACMKFRRLGFQCVMCSDVFYQYETAMRLTEKDVAIAISNSGRSANVVNAMKIARSQNSFTCCITQGNRTPLTKCCDVCLYYSAIDMTIGRDSVNKRIMELMIIEALYLGLINSGDSDYREMLQNTMRSSEMNKL